MREQSRKIRRLCAALLGLVFFLSGFLKLMDPVGTSLIVSDYFSFFHLQFLSPLSKPFGIFLALLESFTGIALITGVWRKIAAWAAMGLTAFFTVVTLIVLIGNPSMDCGCFGEAVHLTHWQTFVKNIILCFLCAVAFFPMGNLGVPRKRKYVAFGLVGTGILVFTVYSLVNIPLVDFTSFKPGTELLASLDNPAEEEDGWISTFVYEKNGHEGSFTLDRLPDSTWTFVRTETIRRNGMDTSDEIPDFSPMDSLGNYVSEKVASGRVMAFTVYDPEKLGQAAWDRISEFSGRAEELGFDVMVVQAAGTQVREDLSARTFFADKRTLMSVNRSNGGLTYFDEGELVMKTPAGSLPSRKALKKISVSDPVETMLSYTTKGRIYLQSCLLYSIVVLLLI